MKTEAAAPTGKNGVPIETREDWIYANKYLVDKGPISVFFNNNWIFILAFSLIFLSLFFVLEKVFQFFFCFFNKTVLKVFVALF